MWQQVYDPIGSPAISTVLAVVPIAVLLVALGIFRIKAHYAALLGLLAAPVIAVVVIGMSAVAVATAIDGACTGLFLIGWIILNVEFRGRESGVRYQVFAGNLSPDTRLPASEA